MSAPKTFEPQLDEAVDALDETDLDGAGFDVAIVEEAADAVAATADYAPDAPPAPPRRGGTIWFTGLPSAGKSTIANALAGRLRAEGHAVQVLDGDEVRPHLSAGLGYSRKDRDINVRRIGWVARLLASHGVVVLVPVIAPYAAARQAVRHDHELARVPFAEVYVSTALAVAEARDVKGLYAKARRGEVTSMTGVDDPYEQPRSAELVLDTAGVPLAVSVERSYALLSSILEGNRP